MMSWTCLTLVQVTWWRHQMVTFSVLLAICAGNSLVTSEFPAQRPVTRSFDVFFDLRLNKWLSKQLWGWWFEMPSRLLWRHCNGWLVAWGYHLLPETMLAHDLWHHSISLDYNELTILYSLVLWNSIHYLFLFSQASFFQPYSIAAGFTWGHQKLDQ